MEAKKSKRPRIHDRQGRPRTVIDWEKVKVWLRAHCTATEIAGKLGVDPDTIYNRCKLDNNVCFTVFCQEYRERGKLDLRLAGYDEAVNQRNTRMLIQLHEWNLDQREKRIDESLIPSRDELSRQESENMLLKAKLAKMQEQLDNITKARQELPGSDTPL